MVRLLVLDNDTSGVRIVVDVVCRVELTERLGEETR